MKKKETILIALGGNALQKSGEEGTVEQQRAHIEETCLHLVDLLEEGYGLVITHGNGPQVGSILLKNEYCQDKLPPMPLDVCGAETQGMIGYMIQQQMQNELASRKRKEQVICLCTQTLVHRKDPAFQKPTKPIGLFYTQKRAEELQEEKGWHLVEQIGKGFRRVVPSPVPVDIMELNVIKMCVEAGLIVIACGGGGIPVIRQEDGQIQGVEAVIDKDRTAAVLAEKLGAEILMILTDVEKVALNFGSPEQKNLDRMSVQEAEAYAEKGEFGSGSMGPKVEAGCSFVKAGGERAIISSLQRAKEALSGATGTWITR